MARPQDTEAGAEAVREELSATRMNPFVFIVGCPRSGTTLLQHMVNAHPQIAVVPESHWIPRFFEKRRGLTPEGLVTPELIPQLLEHPGFTRLEIGREELEGLLGAGQPVSYAGFIAGIFELYGKARGKALVGNKTPGFVRRVPTMHSLWPKARFVHLIRDGRDMYLSTKHRPLKNPKPGVFDTREQDPATTAALWWEWNVRLGRQAGNLLGPELYYEMRYELLVHHPAEQSAALCAFLNLPYDEAMLRFHERQTTSKAARPIIPGLRDWGSQMLAEDQERFEAAAGELLDELGYPRNFPQPRRDWQELAVSIRERLGRDPRTRYGLDRKEMLTQK